MVIASVNGPQYLDECLGALENQTVREQIEVVVADRCGEAVAQLVSRRYPSVRLLSFAERKSIPALRAAAMKSARGEIIAITEDHCLAPPDWCAQILNAHGEHHGIIGGAVDNAPGLNSVMDWATYFCEYSRYMNPVPAGEVSDVPGNNVSYRQEFLAEVSDLLEQGVYWEDALNARLRANGIRIYSDPEIVVWHKKSFGLGEFLSQRYHYSRSYAGIRLASAAAWRKLAYAGFSLVMPPVLLWRIVSRGWGKGRFRGKLLLSVPVLSLFVVMWAWGELVGYLAGPGESLLKVE